MTTGGEPDGEHKRYCGETAASAHETPPLSNQSSTRTAVGRPPHSAYIRRVLAGALSSPSIQRLMRFASAMREN
jgi:hypothetical protein